MAPAPVREPFHRAGWIYEEKVDGWRIVAYKDRDSVCLVSRTGVDHCRRFPDIVAAISKLSARTLVLDGEVAIFDEQLRSRFEWLQDPDPDALATPPEFRERRPAAELARRRSLYGGQAGAMHCDIRVKRRILVVYTIACDIAVALWRA